VQKLDKATKRQILFLLTAMFFLGVSATDIYIASLPQMVADFHSTPQMVNLTLSSYSIGIAFVTALVGVKFYSMVWDVSPLLLDSSHLPLIFGEL
jgi:predicted MFS family arabinose efflux permease